jgi:hypothetical protein
MTEPEHQSMFINLVENSFDETVARGYSYQRSEVHVLKLRPHNRSEAARPGATAFRLESWPCFQGRYGSMLVGTDTGIPGGSPSA